MGFFDANGNSVPEAGDCFVTAVAGLVEPRFGQIFMTLTQDTAAAGTVPLQICQPCPTNGDV